MKFQNTKCFCLPKRLFILTCVSEIWTCLTWLWWFDFRLEQILANDPAISKYVASFQSGQKGSKNNQLATFTKVRPKSLIHTVVIFIDSVICIHVVNNYE